MHKCKAFFCYVEQMVLKIFVCCFRFSTLSPVNSKLCYMHEKAAALLVWQLSLSKKPPERVAFLSQIWYNEKGDKNAAKG